MDFLRRIVKSLSTTFSSVSGYLYNLFSNSQASAKEPEPIGRPTVKSVQRKLEPTAVNYKKERVIPTGQVYDPDTDLYKNQYIIKELTKSIPDSFKKSLVRAMLRGGVEYDEAMSMLENSYYSWDELKSFFLKDRNAKELFYRYNPETGLMEKNFDADYALNKIKSGIEEYKSFRKADPEEAQRILEARMNKEYLAKKAEYERERRAREIEEEMLREEENLKKQLNEMAGKKLGQRNTKEGEDWNEWVTRLKEENKDVKTEETANDLLGTYELEDLFN